MFPTYFERCKLKVYDDISDALNQVNVLIILSKSNKILQVNWKNVLNILKRPNYIFDGKRLINIKDLHELGYENVYQIGY